MARLRTLVEMRCNEPKTGAGVGLFDSMRAHREAAKGIAGKVMVAIIDTSDDFECGSLRAANLMPVGAQGPNGPVPMDGRELRMTGAILGCSHSLPSLMQALVLEFPDWPYGEVLAACWLAIAAHGRAHADVTLN